MKIVTPEVVEEFTLDFEVVFRVPRPRTILGGVKLKLEGGVAAAGCDGGRDVGE